MIHAFIFSRLDCCSGIFTGLDKKINPECCVLPARGLTNTRKLDRIARRPVSQRMDFKNLSAKISTSAFESGLGTLLLTVAYL